MQIEDATSTLTRENKRKILEDELRKISADSSVSISGTGYKITHKKYDFFVNKDLKIISSSGKTFNAVEWDKKAAPEDVFIWKSDDPNNADYGVIIGYKKNVDNYTILRFPSRCTKIEPKYSSDIYKDTGDDEQTVRSYTKNILKVELPDTVVKLEEKAFAGGWDGVFSFASLERVELSKNLNKIENFTFYRCENLKYIEIPDNITEIGACAFSECTNLQQIHLPEGLKKIGNSCFEQCENLQQINLPEGLEEIGSRAFYDTRSLSEIIIPESVKIIGSWAFSGWESSQTIMCKATKAGDNWDKYWNYTLYAFFPSEQNSANIIFGYMYDFDAIEWDKKAAPEDVFMWKSDDPNNADYGVIIGYKKNVDNYTILRFPSRCTKISNDSNLYNSGLYKDTGDDQDTVRSYTKNILKVELPDTVVKLEEKAFAGWGNVGAFSFTSLERVELSKNLNKIENSTFIYCKNLKYIEIPDNITEIGEHAFYGCTNLLQIHLPENLEKIGERAFSGCTNLQQIHLPENLEEIGNVAFNSCDAMKSITIPAGVKEIKDYTFSYCKNLQQIHLPENLEEIGKGAFSNCTNLQQIHLPENLEKIGEEAFGSCDAMKSITIPKSVKSIGPKAFYSWTSSQTIKCKATKPGDNWDKYWNYNYAYPVSNATKISANIIFGYQDDNT